MNQQISQEEMLKVAQKLAYERVQLEQQIKNLNCYIQQLKQQHQHQLDSIKSSAQNGSSSSRDMMLLLRGYNSKMVQLEKQCKESAGSQNELRNQNKLLQQTNNQMIDKNQYLNQEIMQLKQQMQKQQEQNRLEIQKISNNYQNQINILFSQKVELENRNRTLVQKDMIQHSQEEYVRSNELGRINVQLSNQKEQIEGLRKQIEENEQSRSISQYMG